jgi:hypothetical protein
VKKRQPLPVCKSMCATCPFRKGSKYAFLKDELEHSARTEATRICHSTGSNNAINRRTGKPPAACRGARNVQLKMFFNMGFIEAPTDRAWKKKWDELQQQQQKGTTQ